MLARRKYIFYSCLGFIYFMLILITNNIMGANGWAVVFYRIIW